MKKFVFNRNDWALAASAAANQTSAEREAAIKVLFAGAGCGRRRTPPVGGSRHVDRWPGSEREMRRAFKQETSRPGAKPGDWRLARVTRELSAWITPPYLAPPSNGEGSDD